jgi:protein Mpv17
MYGRLLANHPLITKSITVSAMCGLGDVLLQSGSSSPSKVDLARTARMMAHGLIATGPLNHVWHTRVLERIFPTAAGRTMDAAVGKVVLDQAVFAPVIITIFCTNMAVLESKPVDANWPKVLPLIVANWAFWPAAQLLNFRFVPVQHQVSFVGVCMVFWSAYLSHVQFDKDKQRLKQ